MNGDHIKISLEWKHKSNELDVKNTDDSQVIFDEAMKISKLNPNRIRIVYERLQGSSIKRIPIKPNEKVSTLPSTKFIIRDLGPQFSYSGVFYLEYLGPLLIWPIMKLFLNPQPNQYLTVTSMMWTFHYFKRLLETRFVHSFSHQTMPLFNLFKNCTYYWGFATLIAYMVQKNSSQFENPTVFQNCIVPFFFVFEALNGYSHMILKSLRPPGSTAHVLPKGFLFDQITCPNYTMEICSWICFSLYSQTLVSYLFAICGAAQMFVWADKKRKNLIAEFPQVKKRGRLTPFPVL